MSEIKKINTTKIFKLSKHIKAHDEELTELTLREPTGEEIMECGFPHRISADGISFNAAISMKYIEKLAEIPPSSVKQLSPKDLFDLTTLVMDFFINTHQTLQS